MMQAKGYIEEASVHQLEGSRKWHYPAKEFSQRQYESGDLELIDGDIWSTLSKKRNRRSQSLSVIYNQQPFVLECFDH
ncbi:hypothetical protein ACEQPO_25180 [Bacillus sp. SL00103]